MKLRIAGALIAAAWLPFACIYDIPPLVVDAASPSDVSTSDVITPQSLCADAHLICDDFDDASWATEWDAYSLNTMLTLDDASFSPPHALHVVSLVPDGGANGSLGWTFSLPVNQHRFACNYHLRLNMSDATTPDLPLIELATAGTRDYIFGILRLDGGTSLAYDLTIDGGAAGKFASALADDVFDGGWHAVNFELELDNGRSYLTVDDHVTKTELDLDDAGFWKSTSYITFFAGAAALSGPWTASFDDVICYVIQ